MTDSENANAVERTLSPGPGEREFEELTRITNELITTQRQLQKQRALLRKLNDEKNIALGIVAHDLRNPLALIDMQSEFLLGESAGGLSEAQRELLESIAQQGRLMLSIVNDLLDVSAIEAGRFDLHIVHTSISSLVEKSVHRHSLLAAEKLVAVRYEGPGQDCEASVDSHKFEQVLNNLIGNAVKYAPAGSEVDVILDMTDDGFQLLVRDHGPGIPADKLDSLFSPFTTAGIAPTAGEKSTGLGLAIVHRIVSRHGGSITVDSQVGRGSCFVVRMPQHSQQEIDCRQATASEARRQTCQAEASRTPQRILIVDDSVAAAKMTARMIGSFCNARIELAHDGQSALETDLDFQPDVVFLDIELPVLSGLEVAIRLRHRHGANGPQLCAITAHRQGYVDELASRAAFDAILTKPISVDELRDVIANVP